MQIRKPRTPVKAKHPEQTLAQRVRRRKEDALALAEVIYDTYKENQSNDELIDK